MSDVADWTGVSAGATQLIASGTVSFTGAANPFAATINLANIPQTTRSLLIMGFYTPAGGAADGPNTITVQGSTSRLRWISGQPANSDGGNFNFTGGQAMFPIYVPFYGQVDSAGTITMAADNAGTLQYWILALPDADLLGANQTPIAVTNSNFSLGILANPQPVYIKPVTGATFPLAVGTKASPLYVADVGVSESTGAVVTASGVSATLVPAPVGGTVRKVRNIYAAAGSVAGQSLVPQINGVDVGLGVLQTTSGTIIPGPWYLTAHPLTIVTSGGTASVVASWHDE